MRLITLVIGAGILLATQAAVAQEGRAAGEQAWNETSVGHVEPTAEMWFYEQYRQQYDDPRTIVRNKAEFKAEQRQRRLAARRWFGFSNIRPQANSDPFNGDYSPRWTSNNAYYPSRWGGWGGGWIVERSK